MSTLIRLELRGWTPEDVPFTLKVRNHPDIMKYFRQDEPISQTQQQQFILDDNRNGGYNGKIILADGEPVGLCGVKDTGEFTIGLLPEYHGKGIAKHVMRILTTVHKNVWSEVFIGNPALEFFVAKCGFKITGCKERAYYKRGIGLVDVVSILHD